MLKDHDQMEWVRKMNSIPYQTEEIVIAERGFFISPLKMSSCAGLLPTGVIGLHFLANTDLLKSLWYPLCCSCIHCGVSRFYLVKV